MRGRRGFAGKISIVFVGGKEGRDTLVRDFVTGAGTKGDRVRVLDWLLVPLWVAKTETTGLSS